MKTVNIELNWEELASISEALDEFEWQRTLSGSEEQLFEVINKKIIWAFGRLGSPE